MEWEQGETFSRQKVERFSPKAAGESLAGESRGENRELRRFSRSESAREHHIEQSAIYFGFENPFRKKYTEQKRELCMLSARFV